MKKKNIRILNIGLLSGLLVLSSCDGTPLYSQLSTDDGVSSYPTEEYNKMLAPTNVSFDPSSKVLSWNTVAGCKVYDIHVNGKIILEDFVIKTEFKDVEIEIEDEEEEEDNLNSDSSSETTSEETSEEVSDEVSDSTSDEVIIEQIEIIPTTTSVSLDKLVNFDADDSFLISVRAKLDGHVSRYSSTMYDKNAIDLNNTLLSTAEIDNVTYLRGFNKKSTQPIPAVLEIPEGVEVIDIDAFFNDANIINEVVFPSTLTKIADGAFSKTKIKKFNFSKCTNLVEIGNSAFENCNVYSSKINLPTSVKVISDFAFSNTKLNVVIKNDNVLEYIGESALYSSDIANIKINNSIKHLGKAAFANCSDLQTVEFDENISLTEIPDECFKSTSIKSVSLPASILSIGNSAFAGCGSLLSAMYKDGSNITSVGDKAFSGNTKMKYFGPYKNIDFETHYFSEINISSSLKSIGEEAFSSFSNRRDYFNNKDTSKNHVMSLTFDKNCTLESIAKGAFKDFKITSVSFPDSLKYIYSDAFKNTSLETINFNASSNITNIESGAFDGTPFVDANEENRIVFGKILYQISASDKLAESIDLLNTDIVTITDEVFNGCAKLVDIKLPKNLQYINSKAFYRCLALTSIEFPASLVEIGDSAFNRCSSLVNVNFADGCNLEKIGDSAFEGVGTKAVNNQTLKSVDLPDTVTHIGENAFKSCSTIESFDMSDSIVYIGNSAFEGCKKIEAISIPSSITYIGKRAFYGNSSLATLSFDANAFKDANEGERILYEDTFTNCTSLVSVALPTYLEEIRANAFKDARKLTTITHNASEVHKTAFLNTPYEDNMSIQGMVIFGDILVNYNGNSNNVNFDGTLVIPEGVEYIGNEAFAENGSDIKEIVLPSTLKEIQDGAFKNCSSLEKVTFASGSNLKLVGNDAFNGCVKLTTINLPSTIEYLGTASFNKCVLLEQINLSSPFLTEIPDNCFNSCNSLTTVSLSDSITKIGNYAFYQSGLVTVDLSNNLQSIGDYAFAYIGTAKNNQLEPENWDIVPTLKSVNLDETKVTSIGQYAFADNLLEEIKLPTLNENIYLGDYCFANSVNVTSFEVLENYVFSQGILNGAENLTEISVYKNQSLITIFGGYVAYVPASLTTIYINGDVTEINSQAFAGLSSVEKIVFETPELITKVESNAFYGCSSLEELNLPNLQYIGESSFFGCSNLDLIFTESNVDYIGSNAFIGTNYLDEFDADADGEVDDFIVVNGTLIKYNGDEKHIVLDDSITSIAGGAFSGNQNIESITFGKNITKISAGSLDSCTSLKEIVLTGNSVINLDAGTFDSLSTDLVIKVKPSLVDDYKNDVYWSLYADQIESSEE